MSVCHLLSCTSTHKQCAHTQKNHNFFQEIVEPQQAGGSQELDEGEEEHKKMVRRSRKKKRGDAARWRGSGCESRSWCDWVASVSARWVTEEAER